MGRAGGTTVVKTLAVAAALTLAAAARAQGPDAEWRTVTTEHFRLHFPVQCEAWALRTGAQLESIRARVVDEVGYAPPQVVDVLVMDPAGEPNGLAISLLNSPRMVLFASPPGPESVIGYYRDWPEMVATHEYVHLAHMLQPSRHPMRRLVHEWIGAGPIALRAPRWLVEGYATLLEGRLTGSGRPASDLRASILRVRAAAGELPSYGQLSSDDDSWLGMSMAYLAGSAFLEWLEQRAGQESLRHLWRRMTAREGRSFDEAFSGVFGQPPRRLYNRFTAELTHAAIEVEQQIGEPRTGELWQDLQWTTGAPAVSPDGEFLAIVLRHRDRPAELVVWSTGPNQVAEQEWQTTQQRLLERDPLDVAAQRTTPLAREPVYRLRQRSPAPPAAPRWLRSGDGLLFHRLERDADGLLHPDLFVWHPARGTVRRITRVADVRDADPGPEDSWAVAVRRRWGLSQLVRVDLNSGQIEALTDPALDRVHAHPRVSPDGSLMAYVRHAEGCWQLMLRRLDTGVEQALSLPAAAMVGYPAFSSDGAHLYASVGEGGFIDVWRFDLAGDASPERVTLGTGAALAPDLAADGSAMYLLALEFDGLDLRRLELEPEPTSVPLPELAGRLVPAVPPLLEPVPALDALSLPPARSYGLGRQELRLLTGFNLAPSAETLELVVRSGDLLSRTELLAVASLAEAGGAEGGALAAAWRGWPVELSLAAYDVRERPSAQPTEVAGLGTRLDLQRTGLDLGLEWRQEQSLGVIGLDAHLLLADLEPAGEHAITHRSLLLAAVFERRQVFGSWQLRQRLQPRWQEGETGGQGWRRLGGRLDAGLFFRDTALTMAWQVQSSSGQLPLLEHYQLGGIPYSVLPDAARANVLMVPALPQGLRLGERHEGQSLRLRTGNLPSLFYQRHRLWNRDEDRGRWLSLAGFEWRLAADQLGLIRAPSIRLTLGAARILDGHLEGDEKYWLGLTWRP